MNDLMGKMVNVIFPSFCYLAIIVGGLTILVWMFTFLEYSFKIMNRMRKERVNFRSSKVKVKGRKQEHDLL